MTLPATWAEKGKAILPLSGICVRKPQFSKPLDEEDDLRLSNVNSFAILQSLIYLSTQSILSFVLVPFLSSCKIISDLIASIFPEFCTLASSHTFLSAFFLFQPYRDWETDRKSTRLNSSHSAKSRMPSSA